MIDTAKRRECQVALAVIQVTLLAVEGEETLSWESLVLHACQYGKAINITEAEVHNVLTQSVQTIVLERDQWG